MRVAVRGSACCGASSVTSGPGIGGGHAHGDQLDLGVGVAVAVALLVQVGEGLLQVVGVGDAVALDRELEGLAAVAQLVHHTQRGVRLAQGVAGRGGEVLHVRADRLGGEVVAGTQDAALGVAAAVADHEAERGQHAGRARAEDALDPELLARSAAACRGPAPPKAISA